MSLTDLTGAFAQAFAWNKVLGFCGVGSWSFRASDPPSVTCTDVKGIDMAMMMNIGGAKSPLANDHYRILLDSRLIPSQYTKIETTWGTTYQNLLTTTRESYMQVSDLTDNFRLRDLLWRFPMYYNVEGECGTLLPEITYDDPAYQILPTCRGDELFYYCTSYNDGGRLVIELKTEVTIMIPHQLTHDDATIVISMPNEAGKKDRIKRGSSNRSVTYYTVQTVPANWSLQDLSTFIFKSVFVTIDTDIPFSQIGGIYLASNVQCAV